MISMTQMYWFTRLDGLNAFFSIFAVLCGIAMVVIGIIGAISEVWDDEEDFAKWKKAMKILAIIFAITLPPALLIPTTKEMAVIYVVPKIVNNDKVQQIPDKLLDLANQKLDEWTKGKESK